MLCPPPLPCDQSRSCHLISKAKFVEAKKLSPSELPNDRPGSQGGQKAVEARFSEPAASSYLTHLHS